MSAIKISEHWWLIWRLYMGRLTSSRHLTHSIYSPKNGTKSTQDLAVMAGKLGKPQHLFQVPGGGPQANLYHQRHRRLQPSAAESDQIEVGFSDRWQPVQDALSCHGGHHRKVDRQTQGLGYHPRAADSVLRGPDPGVGGIDFVSRVKVNGFAALDSQPDFRYHGNQKIHIFALSYTCSWSLHKFRDWAAAILDTVLLLFFPFPYAQISPI